MNVLYPYTQLNVQNKLGIIPVSYKMCFNTLSPSPILQLIHQSELNITNRTMLFFNSIDVMLRDYCALFLS